MQIHADKKIILASGSPRRAQLLGDMGIEFEVNPIPVDESFPPTLPPIEIAEYLAQKKSEAYLSHLKDGEIVITADTIVHQNGKILNKPADEEEALSMLTELAGQKHDVITGVALRSLNKLDCFHSLTQVHFAPLSRQEIEFYVQQYKPYDKAGAYGIQEWIGYIAVEKIEGSYFNVVGLPTQALYQHLSAF